MFKNCLGDLREGFIGGREGLLSVNSIRGLSEVNFLIFKLLTGWSIHED